MLKEPLHKVFTAGALLYFLVSLVSFALLPSWINISLDNFLFPFAMIHFINVIRDKKILRWNMVSFIAVAVVVGICDFVANGKLSYDHLLSVLVILKLPLLATSLLQNEWVSRNYHLLLNGFDYLFLIVVGLNLFMALDLNGWGFALQEFYVPKGYTNFMYNNEWGTYRLAGVFTNPNNNAFVFGGFAIYYAFIQQKRGWYFLLLALMVLILTQSRTVLIALALIFLIAALKKIKVRNLKLKWWYFLVVLMVFAISFYGSSNLYSIVTLEAFTSDSFLARFSNIQLFFDSEQSILFGSGIIENSIQTHGIHFDSEFVALLFQSGILGLLSLLVVYTINSMHVPVNFARNSWRYLFLFYFICSSTNLIFFNNQISVFPGALLAVFLLIDDINNRTPMKNPKQVAT